MFWEEILYQEDVENNSSFVHSHIRLTQLDLTYSSPQDLA